MAIVFVDASQNEVIKPEDEKIFWRVSMYPIVQNKEGKVLMVTPRWNDQWEFPGGGVELEEILFDGMTRECYEETGYKIAAKPSQPIHVGEQYWYGRRSKKFFHSVHIMYEAELIDEKQDQNAINPDGYIETIKVGWIPLEELNENNCHPIHFPAIKVLQDKQSRHIV